MLSRVLDDTDDVVGCEREKYSWGLGLIEAYINDMKELPPAQPEQRWIPSGEKPPEEGSYLVWMPFAPPKHRMTVAKYCGGYWNIKTPISAWMPLPEPYGGDQNG